MAKSLEFHTELDFGSGGQICTWSGGNPELAQILAPCVMFCTNMNRFTSRKTSRSAGRKLQIHTILYTEQHNFEQNCVYFHI